MSAFQSKSVCFHFKFPVWPRQPEPCGIEETVRPCTLKVLVRCPVGLGGRFQPDFCRGGRWSYTGNKSGQRFCGPRPFSLPGTSEGARREGKQVWFETVDVPWYVRRELKLKTEPCATSV